jgi:regulator of replication initiation timing
MFHIKDIFSEFAKRGLFQTITNDPCDVRSCISGFNLHTIEDIGNVDDLQIQSYYRAFPKKIDEMKQLRNCCLYNGEVRYPDPNQPHNDEGAPVYFSDLPGHTHLGYCGRYFRKDAMPGSDGHCGPKDGPQCWACEHYKPGVSAKTGAGACEKISELNRQLVEADRATEAIRHSLNTIIQNNREASALREEHYRRTIQEKNEEIRQITRQHDHYKRCYDQYDQKYDDLERNYRDQNAELQTLKRQKKSTNAVLTDLCSGEVPGSLTDVEEAARQAKQLVLLLEQQVETMRAEKERREAAEKILAAKLLIAQDKAPTDFRCPISLQLMVDPVIVPSGTTFDRPSIVPWIKVHKTCPNTRDPLTENQLIPNRAIKGMIEAFIERQELPQ